jgi:hypothetical protein
MNLIQFVASGGFDQAKAVSLLEQIKCSTTEEILYSLAVKMKLVKSILSQREMDLFQEMFCKAPTLFQVELERILVGAQVDFWRFTVPNKPFPDQLKTILSESKNVVNVRYLKPLFGPFQTKVLFYQHSQNVVPSPRCTENCTCKQTQHLIPFDQYCEEKDIQSIEILVLNTEYNDQFLCGAQKMIPRIQCIVTTDLIEIKDRILIPLQEFYLSVLPSFQFKMTKPPS